MEDNILENEFGIKQIFELQMEYKWSLRKTSAADRINKLKRLKAAVLKYEEDIVEALYKDFKKPAEEVLLTEIFPVTSEIKHVIQKVPGWMKRKRVRTPLSHFGSVSRIIYEPRGVSLIMAPWNFPFQLAISPVISAIAAGNCVMLKPSEFSPATTSIIKKLISDVFDEREIAVIEGDYRVAQKLLELPFDNIFFTGSPEVGKIVMRAAAEHLTTVTLELGGKSPVIVHPSADIDSAAKKIAWGKTLNAGQICVAPDYILVEEGKKEQFVKLIDKYFKQFYGDMSKISGDIKYCRIINERHFARIRDLLEEAVEKGANISSGGHLDEEENLISPTVLTEVAADSKILEEEIFGPILPVLTYKTIDDALGYIKSKPKPLALYIFSNDKEGTNYILSSTESGDAVINDVVMHVANMNLPFGGLNNSGIGKSHGYHGFMAFTHERSLMKQGRYSASAMFYPPFKKNTRSLVEKLIKHL